MTDVRSRTLSFPQRVRALVELLHPVPVLLVMITAVLFGLIATGGRPDPARLALLLVALFGGQAAIGALNEYHDRALDALVKPERPIPSGRVSGRLALGIAGVGLLALVLAGARLGAAPLLVGLAGTGLGIVYDFWLKGTPLSWVPYLLALPLLPIWVWLSLAHLEPRVFLLYPIGAPVVLAVHLAQSLPDVESDRAQGVRGVAARLGRTRAVWVVFLATLIAALQVVFVGVALGHRPAASLVAGTICVLAMSGAAAWRTRAPAVIDRALFPLVGALTIVLGAGLVISVGL